MLEMPATLPLVTASVALPQPVKMWPFITGHMSAPDDAMSEMVKAAREQMQPYKSAAGVEMLDVRGQRTFWECFHDVGAWQECPDCPHEYEPTIPARKRSESRPNAKETGLPEGCILASQFAKMHGVPDSTFRHHIKKGIEGEKADVSRRDKPNRAGQQEYYLTPEQQQATIEYWKTGSSSNGTETAFRGKK